MGDLYLITEPMRISIEVAHIRSKENRKFNSRRHYYIISFIRWLLWIIDNVSVMLHHFYASNIWRQAIIWTSADYFIDVYMRHSAAMSLY